MTPTEAVVTTFYNAFQKRDGQTMADCYAPDVEFSDPVFQKLKGGDAGKMWKMLCSRSTDLKIEYTILAIAGDTASVKWDAFYSFGKKRNKVHNQVHATIIVRNGRIASHQDTF